MDSEDWLFMLSTSGSTGKPKGCAYVHGGYTPTWSPLWSATRAVGEAAVIGKPDPIKGEAIKAFVLLRNGREPVDPLRAELVEHVRKVLGPIAAPAELEFATKLPKTRSGKIMRRVLKAQELGLDPGDVSTIEE